MGVVQIQRAIDKYVGPPLCYGMKLVNLVTAPFVNKKEVHSILIVRLWAIGEALLTLPMIKALRKKYPKAKISVLVQPRVEGVFRNLHMVDEVIMWGPSVLKYFKQFDLAIDTEPYLKISAICAAFMGKEVVGFSHGTRAQAYTYKIEYDDNQHVVQTYFDMIREMGINADSKSLVPLDISKKVQRSVDKILKTWDVKKPMIAFGACTAESALDRRWPAEYFAELGDKLIEKHKATIILLGAPADREHNNFIIEHMKHVGHVINAAGETTLVQSFELIRRCKAVVSNDSGPMHMAAAMGTKTVGLFGPNTPVRFAPYGKGNDFVYKNPPGSPWINVHKGEIEPKNVGDPDCMEKITVSEVYTKLKKML